ncbi:AI-2E family transporter [Halobacillus sp. A5]|uniref:AI-2E family transporter n=1 Tax=Halobacillus sp. A5 TaxID=2880263 RepID=UPI0020A6B801|nr:AI-2E family transporter [Halobacillus sp. A5]MCP3025961.1 AI-2E family transporter [Halobacillus sp. A5]
MWIKHSYFKYMTGFILALISIYLLTLLDAFAPVTTIISTLFYPILIAGFIYYIFKPVVQFLAKAKYIPLPVAILIVYTAGAGLFYLMYRLLAATVQSQVSGISSDLPDDLKESAKEAEETIQENDMGMVSMSGVRQQASSFFGDLTSAAGDHATEILSAITGAATVLVVIPFVLFFFLKDGHRLIPFLMKYIPAGHQEEGRTILKNVDKTLSAYIIGQITVAFTDAVLMFIGYLIIGLDYALVLSLFVFITAVVPFFGPLIGVLPAVIVSLTQDPAMIIYVFIILIVVQQLEGNIVAPVVLGNRLNVHPLTIILLLIVAAALYGFIGMLIAIPLYSVLKVIIKNVYAFYRLRQIQT